jgi:ABC-type lipoprotein export system ATPase subunit
MIKLVDVSKYYTANGSVALGLRKASLELHLNEFVAVVGESGSGKTTLLNIISGIDTYEEGEMYLNGEETSYYSTADLENYRKKYIAFVFQNYNLVDAFTVLQNVELPLLLAGVSAKESRRRALDIIRRVGLEKHIRHKATKLSGGQKQRVVIARALAKDCPIIAADEPTGNLDSVSARQIIELLHEISRDKLVIIVTHDYDQVKEFATRKIRIYDGEIVEDLEVVRTEKDNLPVIPDESKKIRFGQQVRLALDSLLSVPKKTILMMLVFFIFAFLVVMVYGATISIMSGSSYSIDFTYFKNDSISRIVVRKQDKSAFSSADLAELEELSQAKTVVTQDYLLDIEFYLQANTPVGENNDQYIGLGDVKFLPMSLIDSDSLLWKGRLPAEDDEAILVLPAESIDTLEEEALYLDHEYQIGASEYQGFSGTDVVDIVGLARANDLFMADESYLVVSDALLAQYAQSTFINLLTDARFQLPSDVLADKPNYWDDWVFDVMNSYEYPITVDDTLADDEIQLSGDFQYFLCDSNIEECGIFPGNLIFMDAYHTTRLTDVGMSIVDPGEYEFFLKMNQANYDQIYYDDIYQVTVFAESDINVSRLVSRIANIQAGSEDKYKAVYPFAIEPVDPFNQAIRFFETLGMIITLVITVIGATFLSYLIFRVIINTKLRDFAIYRTVGANQGIIRMEIHLENFLVVSFSYLLFMILLLVLRYFVIVDQYNILYALKQFGVVDYILFYGILVLMSTIISTRYCGRIFGSTVQTALKTE